MPCFKFGESCARDICTVGYFLLREVFYEACSTHVGAKLFFIHNEYLSIH